MLRNIKYRHPSCHVTHVEFCYYFEKIFFFVSISSEKSHVVTAPVEAFDVSPHGLSRNIPTRFWFFGSKCHVKKEFTFFPTLKIVFLRSGTGLRCHYSGTGQSGARIFKLLWSPGIDSKEWIPPAYVAWRAGRITLFLRCLAPIDFLKIPARHSGISKNRTKVRVL
jgi:hypothetical protein